MYQLVDFVICLSEYTQKMLISEYSIVPDKIHYIPNAININQNINNVEYIKEHLSFEVIGETLDDAVGESFDKVARVLGLPYPGGVSIDKLSKEGVHEYNLPNMKHEDTLNFSYSGLKTAVINLVHKLEQNNQQVNIANMAKSFQDVAIKELLDKVNLAIKKYDVKISHNPCSNMKLASGISPVAKLLENGICVSLGTDGASSNNNLDLLEEMKFASLLQKVDTLNPLVLPACEVLKMATINGARALGLEDEIGSIEVGKKADLILLDTNSVNMTPDSSDLCSNVVYSANGSNVDTTICNGKILMENKKLTTLDEEEIYKKARIAIKELKEMN